MSEETIFSEVDEELRRERMRNLWKRFAPFVIGAAVVVVLVVAANEGWNWYKNSASATASDAFYSAVELADTDQVAQAQEALEAVAADSTGQYPLLARFRQASLLAQDGKADAAIAAFDALATEASDKSVRELALLRAAFLLADKADVAGVRARVDGLINPENTMSALAQEAVGLAQYAAGDADGARATFEDAMNGVNGAVDASGRLQLYVAQLIAEGAADPNPAAEQETSEAVEAAPASDASDSPAQ